jgi:beta-ureidopropionase
MALTAMGSIPYVTREKRQCLCEGHVKGEESDIGFMFCNEAESFLLVSLCGYLAGECMNVRSALVQAKAACDKQTTIEKHVAMIEQAAAKGVHITCLQELFFSPYFPQVMDREWFNYAEPIPGPTIHIMQEVAKNHRMVLVAPIFEVVGSSTFYNSAAVIDANGKLLGVYRKNHIPEAPGIYEKFYFKPGNAGYPVFQSQYAKIGILLCYDRYFPEAARILGLNGAEIVYIPAATRRGLYEHLWLVVQRAHAITNGYFVGTQNRIGLECLGQAEFYGSSYFCDPSGNILAQASDCEEQVLVADLDLSKIDQTRNFLQVYPNRRPETYQDLIEPCHKTGNDFEMCMGH